jgi:Putative restriction endonuclease
MGTAVADRLVEALIRELPCFGPENAVCLTGVTWDQYRRLRDAQEEFGRRLQISYCSGRLEILPNRFRSECRKVMLRCFVWRLAEVFEHKMYSLGSTTLDDPDADYGFDSHESFCFTSASLSAEPADTHEPSSDLVIEVEQPSRALNRLALCARAGIREVWYHDLDRLRILSLQSDRSYSDVDYSPTFPLVSSQDLNRFLSLLDSQDHTTISRQFGAWANTLKPTIVSSPGRAVA